MVETVKLKAKKAAPKTSEKGTTCPKCSEGLIIKGKTVFGCSRWKEGCDLRIPFKFLEKKLTEKQIKRLIEKKATTKIKGFKLNGQKVDGILIFNSEFKIEFQSTSKPAAKNESAMPACPKCKKGTIIRGQTAYGCSAWKSGCTFRFTFDEIKAKANGKALTKELVLEIIKS